MREFDYVTSVTRKFQFRGPADLQHLQDLQVQTGLWLRPFQQESPEEKKGDHPSNAPRFSGGTAAVAELDVFISVRTRRESPDEFRYRIKNEDTPALQHPV